MPDPDPSRKPPKHEGPRRFWLYAPFVALLLAVLAWSGWWLYAARQVGTRLDAAQAHLRASGLSLDWSGRRIEGYPFRLDVTLDGFRATEPSGWALAADTLKAEAFAYAPDHWVLVAPKGVALTRPGAGATTIRGQALRASIVADPHGAPRISVEGLKLAFTPEPGAQPFPLHSADGLGLYLRQAGGDAVELFVRIDQGQVPAAGVLGAVAEGKPISLAWQATLSKAAEAHGRDLPAAVRAWSSAGGTLTVEHATLTAGRTVVEAKGGPLSADPQGYLRGALDLDLKRAPQLRATLGDHDAIDPKAAGSVTQAVAVRLY